MFNKWLKQQENKRLLSSLLCLLFDFSPIMLWSLSLKKKTAKTVCWILVCLKILEAASQIASGCVNRHVITCIIIWPLFFASSGSCFSPPLPVHCSNKEQFCLLYSISQHSHSLWLPEITNGGRGLWRIKLGQIINWAGRLLWSIDYFIERGQSSRAHSVAQFLPDSLTNFSLNVAFLSQTSWLCLLVTQRDTLKLC